MAKKRGPKKVSMKTVQEIRFLYETGEWTQQRLGLKFRLSQSTICKIVNNYIHKNVPTLKIGGSADVKLKAGFRYGD